MTTSEAGEKVFAKLVDCQISTYTSLYAQDVAVITISNIVSLIEGLTRYRARKALKMLMEEGVVEYKSQGCPAVESFGEYRELVCEAGSPINGYCLTKKGYETDAWKQAYKDWEKSMAEWADGKEGA